MCQSESPVTFTIRGEEGHYYAHVSRQGHPGEQFEEWPTIEECIKEVLDLYPEAVRTN